MPVVVIEEGLIPSRLRPVGSLVRLQSFSSYIQRGFLVGFGFFGFVGFGGFVSGFWVGFGESL